MSVPEILHSTCESGVSRGGTAAFKPTGRPGWEFDGNPLDDGEEETTEIWKCEDCDATVGVSITDEGVVVYI